MKNDFRNDGSANTGWLADGDVTERLDGQGFLKEQPEKAAPASDYERAMQGLYEASVAFTKERGDDGSLQLLAYHLKARDPAAAHQIREGIRDAEKVVYVGVDHGREGDDQTCHMLVPVNRLPPFQRGKSLEAEARRLWESANPVLKARTVRVGEFPQGTGLTPEKVRAALAKLDRPMFEYAELYPIPFTAEGGLLTLNDDSD